MISSIGQTARSVLLECDLIVSYGRNAPVLSAVNLRIERGEILALVGESGSGKSTLALALLRLLDSRRAAVSGSVMLNGRDLLALGEKEMRRVRGTEISLVLQSAATALNPMLRISSHFREAWRAHAPRGTDWRAAAMPLLERVCLPTTDDFLRRFPSEISIGQSQRLLIAMALLHRPALLIADEPTSALDPITHAETLKLIRQLNHDLNLSVLLISHDLLSAASLCSRLAILRCGQIVETGPVSQIFGSPKHFYTRALIDALPPAPLVSREQRIAS